SPINEQNRALIAGLESELAERDLRLPIYFGNRNWKPYTADALSSLHADGHRRVLGLITSAYSSYSGSRPYREDLARRLDEAGLLGEVSIEKSRSYFNHRGFLDPIADGVREAVTDLSAAGHDASRVKVLFCTHAIAQARTEASGPAGAGADVQGGWCVAKHLAACRELVGKLGETGPSLAESQLVYH